MALHIYMTQRCPARAKAGPCQKPSIWQKPAVATSWHLLTTPVCQAFIYPTVVNMPKRHQQAHTSKKHAGATPAQVVTQSKTKSRKTSSPAATYTAQCAVLVESYLLPTCAHNKQ